MLFRSTQRQVIYGAIACLLVAFAPSSAQADSIHDAVRAKDFDTAQALLDANPDLRQSVDTRGNTPLHIAAALAKDMKWLELTYDESVLNAKDGMGRTPLFTAAGSTSSATLWLLEKGADSTITNRIENAMPLHWAAESNELENARALLAHGAEVNAPRALGSTALGIAARFRQSDMVALLLEHGADVDAANVRGWAALHFAARNGDLDSARHLVEAGADPMAKALDGASPQSLAEERGHQELLDLFNQAASRSTEK